MTRSKIRARTDVKQKLTAFVLDFWMENGIGRVPDGSGFAPHGGAMTNPARVKPFCGSEYQLGEIL
jgi:hypothetical protein